MGATICVDVRSREYFECMELTCINSEAEERSSGSLATHLLKKSFISSDQCSYDKEGHGPVSILKNAFETKF